MSTHNPPFNISLIDPSKNRLVGLLPVQSMDIHDVSGDYHSQGLYSNAIFGKPGEHSRSTRHSFIDMRTQVLHPKIYQELTRLKSLYKGILSGNAYAVWDNKIKDFKKSNIVDGETGYNFFIRHYNEIKLIRNESSIRDLRINLIDQYRDKSLVRYLIVIPAGLRDITVGSDGRIVEDEINLLYRKVLRIANTLPTTTTNTTSVNDLQRWNLQKTFNEIYEYIELIISRKKGFILSKWAGRRIQGGTRNVITAMDSSPNRLGGDGVIAEDMSMVGLHQYMKGTLYNSIHNIKNGVLSEIINTLPNKVTMINKKTLALELISPDVKFQDRWGSEQGIEDLIDGFGKIENRHKPIIINDRYAALIYKDDTSFKVFRDINELPTDLDRAKVTPLTYLEFFYIDNYIGSTTAVGFVTRYPIATDGSIYPCKIYLKPTIKTISLLERDTDWSLENSKPFHTFPVKGGEFYDSMSVSPSREVGLNADHDGDKTSLNILSAVESIKEVTDYLNSKVAYFSPDGNLRYGFNGRTEVAELVLHNFTQGLEK